MPQAATAADPLRRAARKRRPGGSRSKAAGAVQIPPIPTSGRVSNADVVLHLKALHDCVHQTQKQTSEGFRDVTKRMDDGFEKVHNRVTEVAQRVSFVEGQSSIIARQVGAPVKEREEGEETPVVEGKATKPFGSLSRGAAMAWTAVSSIGGLALLQIVIKVWPAFVQFCAAVLHAITSVNS